MASQMSDGTVLRALPELLDAAQLVADECLRDARAQRQMPAGNALIHGDNLSVIARLAAHGPAVDLIYIDPPFASGSDYRVVARRPPSADAPETPGLVVADGGFGDRWDSGLLGYLSMLAPRLMLMKQTLAETGSIYVHVDWHASHWVRVLLDEVFGASAFCNEIAWLYGLGGSSPRRWPRKHDTIFWYAAVPGSQWFSPSMVPATSARMRGQLKKAPDYWDIPALNNQAHERTGYPTQKPAALLQRIVESSCPPGGIVADFFAGSGTTAAVADSLGRSWISVDSGDAAIALASARLGVAAREWMPRGRSE